MVSSIAEKRIRYNFGKIASNAVMPNLIQVQKRSYEDFLQIDKSWKDREETGLELVLKSIFPISDYDERATLEYVKYELDPPKYEKEESVQRGVNYASPLRVTLRLIVWDIDEEVETKEIKGIKEQDVYMGEIPLMTESGTFIINGAQRVVVSQMHRSPGVFYSHDDGKSGASGKYLYSARVIPYRGSWLDFEFDAKDILHFRIDKKRKMHVTTLLKALDYSNEDILNEFYAVKTYEKKGDKFIAKFNVDDFQGTRLEWDIVNSETGKTILKTGERVTLRLRKQLSTIKEQFYEVNPNEMIGKFTAENILDDSTGEVILKAGDEITEQIFNKLIEIGIQSVKLLNIEATRSGAEIRSTLMIDKNNNKDEALADIYKVLRPGEPSTPEVAEALFKSVFFSDERYDLSSVGRMKINMKHSLDTLEEVTVLTKEDIIAILKHIIALKNGIGEVDDIDNLANRRVRSAGELLTNQFRLGLIRMQKSIIERMGAVEIDSVMPHDLVNSKALMSVIREFFGTSQLSQFMDQTNPLSEITHKRRLSALGPGGLTRERAGFEVRDVHPTHYSRICPIETPEGQNIGLINSLATCADIDKFGFIQSPYRRVVDGKVIDTVDYLTAIEEAKFTIAQANTNIAKDGLFQDDIITCRKKGEIITAKADQIDYIDVSPKQLVSVAASLIPFLENDDANRALMGSNMQRQAVPLLKSEAPVVGTGMEDVVARDSGVVIVAKRNGIVDKVDANRIVVKVKNEEDDHVSGVDIYNLVKYRKSNQSTCINQRPIVKQGDIVKKGSILADGPCTDLGELALGKNVLVAFMPWNGYNFEDSILVSERLVSNDVFTSIHIKEYEIIARDTRLGPEEITRDIPNVNEENLRHLDEVGIVHVGAKIEAGDILVGKVTPKTESPLTPEEKLLRAIFGEKAADVRDSSLRVSPGDNGTVIGVKIFTRRGVEKDERALLIEHAEIERLAKDRDDQVRIIEDYVYTKLKTLILNKKIVAGPKKGEIITEKLLANYSKKQLWQLSIQDENTTEEVNKLKSFLDSTLSDLKKRYERRIEKVQSGDDLPQGALKVIKIYIATKLKLQPGDKMAGRHGNKGVISKIVPAEDMPFLDDGTPVDIVLNPLGVPSRMNIGQILETHLGWASINIGRQVSEAINASIDSLEKNNLKDLRDKLISLYPSNQAGIEQNISKRIERMSNEELLDFATNMEKGMCFASPVFDGAKEKELNEVLKKAGVDVSGQVQLRDGRTGEEFKKKVTVGYIYMLKLDHLVDNKIHARSVGPYSLVTQQPLGGKSHFGGQRFGEMECWALQGYGASYTLQEILTVKSDDVTGRVRTYEAIIRGDNSFEPGVPESFKVMVKELRSLALNVEMKEFDNVKNLSFDEIKISIADPDKIRSWSYGEVKRPDTVNYRTIKPENGGLFCARIFGPVKDYECLCGKYKRMKYRGTVCEKCGVEVTTSKVRRDRMGHIELATPVVHIWFLRSLPSRISTLLDIPLKNIEKVLYFEAYLVRDPGVTSYEYGQLINEDEYHKAVDQYGEDAFDVGMGAEIIREILKDIDLVEERKALREELVTSNSETKRRKIVRRLKLIEDFIDSGNKPEMMVLEVLPVIPPDLRPLVMLDGGRFATSDLNELYRRVINRNNRLKRLMELKAPDIIIRNEKRMLQESVDALFDNSRRSKTIKTINKRPLKSLSDMLKGKQGRFRQNLLGKRVDYSGRSVIVVGPELKLHQCGIPKRMALELFKPFIYSKLESYGISTTLKSAKKMVESERPEVWDILEEVINEHPVLLNRAPTLHRLGIQAFEPILIEGKAIQLHPLVCAAFNADFDGDMMAVHVPLSIESQLEARVLMMSTNNILSPANGKPIIVPSQDIILGLYYLSLMFDNEKGEGKVFNDIAEIEHALNIGELSIHAKIKCKRNKIDNDGNVIEYLALTSPGRIMISDLLPKNSKISFDYFNKVMNKKEVSNLIDLVYRYCGQKKTVIFADRLMQLGFSYACKSGISIGKDDIIIPKSKTSHVDGTMSEVREYENQYADGLITIGEKYNKVVDAWSRCTDKITHDMMNIISRQPESNKDKNIDGFSGVNSIYMMADSGARGSSAQMRQLSGMRGLMTKPSGEIIETPITSNFKEGLSELEYFISTHGARKGLADTALKTANSGYLTRKLVDVAQDCTVIEEDCGTDDGIEAVSQIENGEIAVSISEIVLGRVVANDIHHPITGNLIIKKNSLIDENTIELIEEAGIDLIKIRSVLTCKSKIGVCSKCYGRDLATGQMVNIGEAVGVIAAQSIGEPGTQLTMRTFHIGGAAQKTTVQSNAISTYNGILKYIHNNVIKDSKGKQIVMSRSCEAIISDKNGNEKFRCKIPYGANLILNDGAEIKAGEKIAEWDPFTIPILTEKSGQASFVDLVDGISMKEVEDEVTGITNRVVVDSRQYAKGTELRPRVVLLDDKGEIMKLANGLEARYFLPVDAIIGVSDKAEVHAGDVIARIPKESSKSKDITGGLPRVVELFEARQPKDHSLISEISGHIEFGKDYKSKRRIIVKPKDSKSKSIEYFVPRGKHITVNEGDYVLKGDMLMDGNPSPHDILRIMGIEALAIYTIKEVQQVYKLQGVQINNKHIETILRQMLQKVEIHDPGETTFLAGEQIDREHFEEVNQKTKNEGYKVATAIPILQGITKASLQTRSFFSAASFQETTRVLTEASISGKVDKLQGLKENVIVGRLIPAGTGHYIRTLKEIASEQDMEGSKTEAQEEEKCVENS